MNWIKKLLKIKCTHNWKVLEYRLFGEPLIKMKCSKCGKITTQPSLGE